MPVTATPWRAVPSTPARSAYLAWKSLVSAAARAASCAWCTCRGCTVSWRRCDAEVVHSSRTGHGPKSALEKVITMVGVAALGHRIPRAAGMAVRAGGVPGVEVDGERGAVEPCAGPGLR